MGTMTPSRIKIRCPLSKKSRMRAGAIFAFAFGFIKGAVGLEDEFVLGEALGVGGDP